MIQTNGKGFGKIAVISFVLIIIVSYIVLAESPTGARDNLIEGMLGDVMESYNKGLYQQVVFVCNGILGLDEYNQSAHYYRGLAFEQLQDYNQAVKDFKFLVNIEPENHRYWGQLGWVYLLNEQFEIAEEACLQAYQLNQNDYEIAVNLGHVYLLTGNVQKAREYYQESLTLIPSEEAFNEGPLADFDIFISNGWQVELIQEEKRWMESEFANKFKYYLLANRYCSLAERLVIENKYEEAAIMYVKAAEVEQGSQEPMMGFLVRMFDEAGYCYFEINKYEKALECYKKVLGIDKRLRKEGKTATIYNTKESVYHDWCQALVKYVKVSEPEKTSEESMMEFLGITYSNAGFCYFQVRKYKKALECYEKALEIAKGLGKEVNIATTYKNIGSIYRDWGQQEQALESYEMSLEIEKRLGREDEMEISYNEIGSIYQYWGLYERALECYKKVLEIAKRLGKEVNIATTYNNIGSIYQKWGHFEKALEYYEMSLEMRKILGEEVNIAFIYNNMGSVYYEWGLYRNAFDYLEKALRIFISVVKVEEIAIIYNNMGLIYRERGQYEKALKYHKKAIEIDKRLGIEGKNAISYINMGSIYHDRGQYERALEYYGKALKIAIQNDSLEDMIVIYNNIGDCYAIQKHYKKAEENLLKSIEIIEQIRANAPTDELKRTYLQSQILKYQELISVYIGSKQLDKVFNIMELSKAKVLAEKLAGKKIDLSIPYLQVVQQGLKGDEVLVIYANSNSHKVVQMSVTAQTKKGIEVDKEGFIDKIYSRYGEEIVEMIKRKKRIKELNRSINNSTGNLLIEEKDDERFENIIYYYRECLTAGKNVEYLAKELYQFLILPLKNEIANKEELIIVPDGILNYIPFETLIDEDGNYLVEKYKIRYIQSETVSQVIKDRVYSEERKPLMAFGGAVYQKGSNSQEVIENSKQLAYLQQQITEAVTERGSISNFYARLGYGDWNNLPGTLIEVEGISRLVKEAELITGEAVSEEKIKELSLEGILARYRVLHFATHGIAVPEVPELSAVVLSQLGDQENTKEQQEKQNEDGYLRMGEIVDLDIKADFVNLSACETGLGKIYAGEGVVGLTQAFLLAGANSLSVSLWSVVDESTTRFMVGLYRLVEEEGLNYYQALNQVKLMFIRGDFGEEYSHPYYWAPFVYYGN